MNMSELFPQFKEFLDSEVLSENFDFIIPIETKGALVLNEVIATLDKPQPKILYRRAFDFLDPQEIKGKKAAIIDDAVFTGKTINNMAEDLESKGLSEAKKYAFILFDSEEAKDYRNIDDINFSTILKKEQLENLIEELSQLSLKFRPSNPDHLLFSAYLPEEGSADALFDLSKYVGFTVEFMRHPLCRTWSVHYPDWSPAVDKNSAKDSCSNKVRLSIDSSGHVLKLSTQFFPSLHILPNLHIPEPLWKGSYEILSKSWQDEETKIKNLYESFSISIRFKQAKNFISDVQKYGISIRDFHLETSRIEQYFGAGITSGLERLWRCFSEDTKNLKQDSTEYGKIDENIYPDDIYAITKQLMEVLDSDYRKENRSEKNLYFWKSVGRDIDELAVRTGRSKLEVSVGIEILNDYGYCSPMFDLRNINGAREAKRSYRMSETGTVRLYL